MARVRVLSFCCLVLLLFHDILILAFILLLFYPLALLVWFECSCIMESNFATVASWQHEHVHDTMYPTKDTGGLVN